MKIFKSLLILSFISLITISCEPEELPENTSMEIDNINADTGDQKDHTYTGEDD
jgi:hypothetical protein